MYYHYHLTDTGSSCGPDSDREQLDLDRQQRLMMEDGGLPSRYRRRAWAQDSPPPDPGFSTPPPLILDSPGISPPPFLTPVTATPTETVAPVPREGADPPGDWEEEVQGTLNRIQQFLGQEGERRERMRSLRERMREEGRRLFGGGEGREEMRVGNDRLMDQVRRQVLTLVILWMRIKDNFTEDHVDRDRSDYGTS